MIWCLVPSRHRLPVPLSTIQMVTAPTAGLDGDVLARIVAGLGDPGYLWNSVFNTYVVHRAIDMGGKTGRLPPNDEGGWPP